VFSEVLFAPEDFEFFHPQFGGDVFPGVGIDSEGVASDDETIRGAREDVFPGEFFVAKAYDGRGGVVGLGDLPFDGGVEGMAFAAEGELAEFDDDPKDAEAQGGAAEGEEETAEMSGFGHEFWDCESAEEAGDGASDGDFVGEDEVLDIDESACDEEGHEQPEGEDLGAPGADVSPIATKMEEDGVKEDADEEFDPEIAGRDGGTAFGAAAAEDEPGDEGDVVVEGDLVFAGGAKGASGLIDGEAAWEAIDHDVEEGADTCSQKEDDAVEENVEDLVASHETRERDKITRKVAWVWRERK
jgi:hypothetical protein